MRPLIRALVATIRKSATARWTSVSQLRQQTRLVLAERRAGRRRTHRSRRPARPARQPAMDEDWLEAEVLRAILRHPEGTNAHEIGNEVGVDWRRVPAVATRLLDRAVVEQVDHQFYPIVKAS